MDETAHFMYETAHFMDENVTFQSYGSKGHLIDETAKLMEKQYQLNIMMFLYHLRISYCNIIQNNNTLILFKCWCWYYLFLLDQFKQIKLSFI
jgi:hypothetical protein